ncbi:uncharacterized protein J4E92_003289 [Alternaria infectoria]|uniref:uncharacterized protein n=1 Tax=Alternaria infectoria TaxID=45303 RepID=UPI00221F19A3|nr:uncharacterized protein J4E92_003289 [Alternaria infectoria]KAI4933621.1 hypothetical protein J4E92_003289 [Alternaria infectoria]
MPLCDLCQSLDVLDIPKLPPDYKIHTVTRRDYPCLVQISSQPLRDLWKNKQDRPKDQEPIGIPFHQSIEDLEDAAADDCAICKTVQRDVAQFQSDFSGAKKEPGIRAERGGGPDWKMCLVRGVNDTGGFMVVSVDANICQDDSEDWSRETSRMASVYSNAYIMLSATGSPSSTSGLSIFSPNRPAPNYSPFEYTTKDGIKGTLHAFSSSRETAAKPSWAGNNAMLKTEPLSQRGWALQERWLAPRVLHFGTEQIFFECYCSFLSEHGFYLPGRVDTLFPTTSRTFPSHTHPSSPDKPIPDKDNPTLHWHAVLDAYSRRSLTKPSDKLVALSGLARTYASLLPSPTTYLAGHWSPTLLHDLIWQAVGTTTSPAVYRAPSWSWAAIDGPFGLFSPNSGVGWDKGDWTALAKIHATSITLKSAHNPFGEVTDGRSGY